VEYQTMLAWVKAHAPRPAATDPEVTKLHLYPPRRVGRTPQAANPRRSGICWWQRTGCHRWLRFDLDDGVLSVNRDGLVTTVGKGQAALMVRFEGQAEIAQFVNPYSDKVEPAGWQKSITSSMSWRQPFRELGIEPLAAVRRL
jgi:hypothetical protein